jgi:SAM-dependent methyltransferase
VRWNPERYLALSSERGRPFHELVAQIDVDAPSRVVDLGCGPGNQTAVLAERWPGATVLGVDSSAEMIAVSRQNEVSPARPNLEFALGGHRRLDAGRRDRRRRQQCRAAMGSRPRRADPEMGPECYRRTPGWRSGSRATSAHRRID